MTVSEIENKLNHQFSSPINSSYPFFLYWERTVTVFPVTLLYYLLTLRHGGPALISLVNPGLVEGKTARLQSIKKEFRCFVPSCFLYVRPDEPVSEDIDGVIELFSKAGLHFPVVAKPDNGLHGIYVKRLADREQLAEYLAQVDRGIDIHFQQVVDLPGEAGVFYLRHPGSESGRIIALSLKNAPCVVGDGKATLEELILTSGRPKKICTLFLDKNKDALGEIPAKGERRILSFSRNFHQGCIFSDHTPMITPELTKVFDEISEGIPGFDFGRIDILYTSLEELLQGRAFQILEVNGSYSGDGRNYTDTITFKELYRNTFELNREIIEIAAANRKKGFQKKSLFQVIKEERDVLRFVRKYSEHSRSI